MKYKNVKKGMFLKRHNRFIASVLIDGKEEIVHVKNTGRLGELLKEGCEVFLEKSDNPERKTKYDLISVFKGSVLYNIDSQAPNKVFGEYATKLFGENATIRREVGYKNSRFDFYVEYEGKKAFVEVKGVTKEIDGVMLFPDAPTVRGTRHVKELAECIEEGFEAYVVFVIQADAGNYFTPDKLSDKAFAETLEAACKKGVRALAFNCRAEKDSLEIKGGIDVKI